MEQLKQILRRIDGKGYKAYKDIKGTYHFPDHRLTIDHVHGDPFAAPSRISVCVSSNRAAVPPQLYSNRVRTIALEDFLRRATARAIRRNVKGNRGLGKSGEVAIESGGQQVLLRNAVRVTSAGVEARLTVVLPARGRSILAADAEAIFFEELPRVVRAAMCFENLDARMAAEHVCSVEDQEYLRHWLCERQLVAFVADGAVLPRRSGIDDRPLAETALAFRAPESLAVSVQLPNAGPMRGMGIPEGVTLVVGGGFHGKSTLLHALERGIYNHIPGDGRERVVTRPDAVKVRAEDGRVINDVNISPFIDNLPLGRDTRHFSTENASGSTSQAANIIEALETGSKLLLIDEDTSATNFMIRDGRMQALVAKDKEPITPFLHRVRELYDHHGVSSVIVMGGSGDYFEVSDTVIMMDAYEPHDVSERAKRLAEPRQMRQEYTGCAPIDAQTGRKPEKRLLDASRGKRDVKIEARGTRALQYGVREIDLSRVEQLVDVAQTRAIGLILHYYASHWHSDTSTMMEGLDQTFADMETKGLDCLSPYKVGNLAQPRRQEVAAAINRLRLHV